jgi:flagellar assembly factor FliW
MTTETIRLTHPLASPREIPASELWSFPEGLIGFPAFTRFAFLRIDGASPFELLCSSEDPSFALVLVDPALLKADYTFSLAAEKLGPITARDPEELEIRVAVVLGGDGTVTLNLKGPIILSPRERIGIQRISEDDTHEVRFVPQAAPRDALRCSS